VGVVVARHRQDRYLGDGALEAVDPAGALVELREVRVHVARVAPAPRNLLARRADLAERLTVVRHVREDREDVVVLLEGEVLGGRQRHPGRDRPLDRRVVGEVQEDDRTL